MSSVDSEWWIIFGKVLGVEELVKITRLHSQTKLCQADIITVDLTLDTIRKDLDPLIRFWMTDFVYFLVLKNL